MKLFSSFLKQLLLVGTSLILLPMATPAQAGEYGYWKGGYWCDSENNYCHPHQQELDYYEHGYHQNDQPKPILRICIALIGCNY